MVKEMRGIFSALEAQGYPKERQEVGVFNIHQSRAYKAAIIATSNLWVFMSSSTLCGAGFF